MHNQAYMRGFCAKCAEFGVAPDALIRHGRLELVKQGQMSYTSGAGARTQPAALPPTSYASGTPGARTKGEEAMWGHIQERNRLLKPPRTNAERRNVKDQHRKYRDITGTMNTRFPGSVPSPAEYTPASRATALQVAARQRNKDIDAEFAERATKPSLSAQRKSRGWGAGPGGADVSTTAKPDGIPPIVNNGAGGVRTQANLAAAKVPKPVRIDPRGYASDVPPNLNAGTSGELGPGGTGAFVTQGRQAGAPGAMRHGYPSTAAAPRLAGGMTPEMRAAYEGIDPARRDQAMQGIYTGGRGAAPLTDMQRAAVRYMRSNGRTGVPGGPSLNGTQIPATLPAVPTVNPAATAKINTATTATWPGKQTPTIRSPLNAGIPEYLRKPTTTTPTVNPPAATPATGPTPAVQTARRNWAAGIAKQDAPEWSPWDSSNLWGGRTNDPYTATPIPPGLRGATPAPNRQQGTTPVGGAPASTTPATPNPRTISGKGVQSADLDSVRNPTVSVEPNAAPINFGRLQLPTPNRQPATPAAVSTPTAVSTPIKPLPAPGLALGKPLQLPGASNQQRIG